MLKKVDAASPLSKKYSRVIKNKNEGTFGSATLLIYFTFY